VTDYEDYADYTVLLIVIVNKLRFNDKITTECCGPVVNIPVSYSVGLGFKYRPQRSDILTKSIRGFPQSLKANAGTAP
jgi:hypothetical protein